jgi:hypothetical protein
MYIVIITIYVQSQDNEPPCVLLTLNYLYKARTMSGHVYCYHYATCTMPGQWASCVLLPLHYLCKAQTMSGHMYCYHYTICTKLGKWAVMCIVTITLPVQCQDNERSCVIPVKSQVNGRSCVLLSLLYLYKPRKMSGHVYCCHYPTCTKPGKWALMCIVTITLPVESQVNERSCVLLPLHYLYKAR